MDHLNTWWFYLSLATSLSPCQLLILYSFCARVDFWRWRDSLTGSYLDVFYAIFFNIENMSERYFNLFSISFYIRNWAFAYSLLVKTSGKYMSGQFRCWIGNPPDPHRSIPEYSRSSFEHSTWLYGYPDLFQSFVIGYLSTLIYSGGFYWIVEHPYLLQSFSLDRWAQLPDLISTYLTLIIFKPNIYIN